MTRQKQTLDSIQDSRSTLETSQGRLEAASERLEKKQFQMEEQLRTILASKCRHGASLSSDSLDASSPEGRETWMNLGRLLRKEGITPIMIKQNRDVLVKAMKTSLDVGYSPSTPESYQTALESLSDFDRRSSIKDRRNIPSDDTFSPQQSSIGLLGSAPPRGATFTDDFLRRQKGPARSLDQKQNVEEGMQSLLQGMGLNNFDADVEENEIEDAVNLDDLAEAI